MRDNPKLSTDPELVRLLAISPADRLSAVAHDIRERRDEFAQIEAHSLAAALGVTDSRRPEDRWAFTSYAPIRSLEERADERDDLAEWASYFSDEASSLRFAELELNFTRLKDTEESDFGFLTAGERQHLEAALAREELGRNMMNGIFGVARFTLSGAAAGHSFEGDIEDDGACIRLRTPYDERDGKFTDFSQCVTE